MKPDGSFKDVPIGVDPTSWPLDINIAQTKAEADANPVHPGGTFRVYGDFCWGGDKNRAEAYFVPAGTNPNQNVNRNDPEVAKKAIQHLVAQNLRGGAVEAGDTFVTLQRPRRGQAPRGRRATTPSRALVVYDNKAKRASGVTAETVAHAEGDEEAAQPSDHPRRGGHRRRHPPARRRPSSRRRRRQRESARTSRRLRRSSRWRWRRWRASVWRRWRLSAGRAVMAAVHLRRWRWRLRSRTPQVRHNRPAAHEHLQPRGARVATAYAPARSAPLRTPIRGRRPAPPPPTSHATAPDHLRPGGGGSPFSLSGGRTGRGALPRLQHDDDRDARAGVGVLLVRSTASADIATPSPARASASSARPAGAPTRRHFRSRARCASPLEPPPNPYGGVADVATIVGAAGQFAIRGGVEVRVGRDPAQCPITLAEPRVSGVHATLKFEGGQLMVRDEGSNNGTYVNGRAHPGDVWTPVSCGRERSASVRSSSR